MMENSNNLRNRQESPLLRKWWRGTGRSILHLMIQLLVTNNKISWISLIAWAGAGKSYLISDVHGLLIITSQMNPVLEVSMIESISEL